MTDNSSVDPGVEFAHTFINMLASGGSMPDPRDDIDHASLLARFPELQSVAVRDVDIPSVHGSVPGRVYDPQDPSGVALVWIHGGAFIAGDLDMPESNWVALVLASRGIAVLALDYSKALNGVHHPVPNDEATAAWLVATAADSSIWAQQPRSIHLGGASAGANLSAGVALRMLAEGQTLPASLISIYPVMHDIVPAASSEAAAAADTLRPDQRFTPGFMRVINDNYVGEADPRAVPVAFPADGVVAGMSPVLLINAEADDLRPSGEAFAEQLKAAGVPVSLSFEPGTAHGYLNEPGHPGALETLTAMQDWMTK
ncbi:acetyl esterase [Aurantimicrobium minutum]|uniref:alpha/beta hydrolase n=1 Tax=Aurantimicrobium minutum TaxID=708131 RepID=UPI002474E225|nr:alpha/beta hydrolase fold domain-containing protein [Aurantimicrobium minutum]MDH6532558.1 acetyl esterase [Aurantimicrobium minutum]